MTRKNIILTASFCILCVMVVVECIMLIDKVNTTKAKLNQSTVVAYNDFLQNKHDEYKNRIYENIIVSKKFQQKLDIYNKAVATTSQWSAGTHKVCIMDLHDGLSNVYGTPFQRISCIYWSEQSCGADDSTSVDMETEICNENIAFK